jgi:hypothetical protein
MQNPLSIVSFPFLYPLAVHKISLLGAAKNIENE